MRVVDSTHIVQARRELENYLSLTPVEREGFHSELSTKGSSFAEWYSRTRKPIQFDKDAYTVSEATELLFGKKQQPSPFLVAAVDGKPGMFL